MHRLTSLVVSIVLATVAGTAVAQTKIETIWSCKDSAGGTHVTNLKEDTVGKRCRVVRRQRVTVVSPEAMVKSGEDGRRNASTGRPKENSATRASAKDRQREILDKELASEEQLLAKAKAELNEQESIRNGDERNYARVLERLKPYQDSVEAHQRNVDSLRREIANLSR
ncbi:MAG: DUF4124 domain-containing protein [Betaproteobacteria bacterium]|nr:DUF4124 domain-containing protein [Betaproteobacteria bacterium]